jgi:hypothetical protein
MSRPGKIARLPHAIRDQLNQRLQDAEPAKPLLDWLNSLPEVRALLDAQFAGSPITKQNLTDWKQAGFLQWQARHDALDLLRDLEPLPSPGTESLTTALTDKLVRWVALQYAAAAQSLAGAKPDDEQHWTRLRHFCADITRLRQADLLTERLTIDRGWLALKQSNTDSEKEKQFWAWTEREDIREKLYPHHEEQTLSPETLAKIENELKLL